MTIRDHRDLEGTWTMPGPSALHMARQARILRVIATGLLWAAIVGVGILLVAPWQQNVSGTGRVIAYAPLERMQNIEAPIPGRIDVWYVIEGSHVRAGDPIARIVDNDPQILDRLEREREAAVSSVRAASGQVDADTLRLGSLESARVASVASAEARIDIAEAEQRAAQRKLDAAEFELLTAQIQVERMKALGKEGLASKRSVELAELSVTTAETLRDRAIAELAAARRKVKGARADKERVDADALASIEAGRATLARSEAELARAQGALAKVEIGVARQQTMLIVAPRDGTILRVVAREGTEWVSAGDKIATFVPDTASSAVELMVKGNDVPLVTPGRPVRLQFEGWPAVQFVGWPSVAVGTFGGRVAFVDATDNGEGRFRIVVVPDPDDDPWPDSRYLRQGVRANGWILLDRVSLGYELWRQFNGFPPALPEDKSDGKDDEPKTRFAKKPKPSK